LIDSFNQPILVLLKQVTPNELSGDAITPIGQQVSAIFLWMISATLLRMFFSKKETNRPENRLRLH